MNPRPGRSRRVVAPEDAEPIEPVISVDGWADLVYLRRGSMAHVKPFTEQAAYPAALCGVGPTLFDEWRGTGSQTEYDTARGKPLCQRCAMRAVDRCA